MEAQMRGLVVLSIFALVLATGSARAEDSAPLAATQNSAPSMENLSSAIAPLLPPYWHVQKIQVTASINLGDAVEPNLKQRIEADVQPNEPLFVESAAHKYENFIAVLPTMVSSNSLTRTGAGPIPPIVTEARVILVPPSRSSSAAAETMAKSPWRRANSTKAAP